MNQSINTYYITEEPVTLKYWSDLMMIKDNFKNMDLNIIMKNLEKHKSRLDNLKRIRFHFKEISSKGSLKQVSSFCR